MSRWWLPLCMVVPFALTHTASAEEPGVKYQTMTDTDSVKIEAQIEGSGPMAMPGQIATYAYKIVGETGSAAADSRQLTCPVGSERLIAGWRAGTDGMRQGETRRITIPPEMAYGIDGHAPMIPPNATLPLEVRLIDIR